MIRNLIVASGAAFLLTVPLHASAEETFTTSSIVGKDQAKVEQFEGSQFYTYYSGNTFGTKDTLTGVAVIEPDHEIHPPHVHAEEEFLMIIEGSGTWSVNGKELPAKQGDILYAAPWESHGIFNSGNTPLKFVVMKWQSKGVKVPAKK